MLSSVRAAGAIALAAALLSGCTAIPSPVPSPSQSAAADGSQSIAEACAQMKPVLLNATARLQAALGTLTADPSAAPPLLRTISTELRDGISTLTNDDVATVMTGAVDSLDTLTDEIEKMNAGTGDRTALASAGTLVQTEFALVNNTCAAG
ncbi:hypothetical protein BH09ACT6_BH09ACT6_13340 [soil metagenome]